MIARSDHARSVLRDGGHRLHEVLAEVVAAVHPGVTLRELDALAERLILAAGGIPAFKGYHPTFAPSPYPGTLCTSVNDEVVHGLPVRDLALREGDIVGLDIGMRWPNEGEPHGFPSGPFPPQRSLARSALPPLRGASSRAKPGSVGASLAALGRRGLYTDTALTVGVGRIPSDVQRLIAATHAALEAGIAAARVGNRVSDIAKAVQAVVEGAGFSVVRDLVGHGVGRKAHEEPQVPNYWDPRNADTVLVDGMVLAIEPMVNAGSWRVRVRDDGWTIVTADGSRSAHFEHTVLITRGGVEVLT